MTDTWQYLVTVSRLLPLPQGLSQREFSQVIRCCICKRHRQHANPTLHVCRTLFTAACCRHQPSSVKINLLVLLLLPQDCNGNSATGTVTLTYVQPVKATDDVYVQYGKTYQRSAREGVLANDVTPTGCPAGSVNASQILLAGPQNGFLVLVSAATLLYNNM
jgi:hypothetical protein